MRRTMRFSAAMNFYADNGFIFWIGICHGIGRNKPVFQCEAAHDFIKISLSSEIYPNELRRSFLFHVWDEKVSGPVPRRSSIIKRRKYSIESSNRIYPFCCGMLHQFKYGFSALWVIVSGDIVFGAC